MTTVGQIVDPSLDCFSGKQLSSLKVWQKPVDKFAQFDLTLLSYRILREHNDKRKAQRAVDYFMDCWRRAETLGIHVNKLKRPNFKEAVMLLSDLENWLKQMSVPRRRCFMYALISEQNLTEVMEMTWKEYTKQSDKVPEYCRDIVKMMPRHIKSDLVFYELHGSKPLALSGLEFESLMITGKPWVDLLKDSQNVIIDNPEEVMNFLKY